MSTILAGFLALGSASAQTIFVTNSEPPGNSIGSYNGVTGAAINASLVTGLSNPYGLALSGENLYVGSLGSGRIGQYTVLGTTVNSTLITVAGPVALAISGNMLYAASPNTANVAQFNATTGALINGSFITGLNAPRGMTVDGFGNIYVTDIGTGTVGKYTIGDGMFNASFITGIAGAFGIAADGSGNLFVSDFLAGTVGKYSSISGATINSLFITGMTRPTGIALDDGNLYVADYTLNTIGKYLASDGSPVNIALVTGLINPVGLQVMPIPEPTTLGILACVGSGFLLLRRKRTQKTAC